MGWLEGVVLDAACVGVAAGAVGTGCINVVDTDVILFFPKVGIVTVVGCMVAIFEAVFGVIWLARAGCIAAMVEVVV